MIIDTKKYEWKSEYLEDNISSLDFVKMSNKDRIKLIGSTFSNFIKYGIRASALDEQQARFIFEIDDALATREKMQISVASGHGTGKTTILSWVILYVGLTIDDCKIPATAPVAAQLTEMLLPEVKKWTNKIYPPLKNLISTNIEGVKFANNNRCFARTARKENTEALAGVHASFVLYIIDEASGVDQRIFEVIDGALTGEYLQILTSNPTRTTGTFHDSHNKNKNLYRTVHMNSEISANVKKKWLKDMADKYGADSMQYRVRVKGMFPTSATDSLFSLELIEEASSRNLELVDRDGVFTYALDIARFGDDKGVLTKRKNNLIYGLQEFSNYKTTEYANSTMHSISKEDDEVNAIFVDTIGVGAGVKDRLQEMGAKNTIEANVSMKPDNEVYLNKRAEMYFNLKEFLEKGGVIPNNEQLKDELLAISFFYNVKGKLQITPKSELKEVLGRSPDKSDSVALHFFSKVIRSDITNNIVSLQLSKYKSKRRLRR